MDITYRGHNVRVATGGRHHDKDLPGLVLIHGSGMDRTTWQLQTRWFAHHGFRVAAIDLPGHGASGGEPLTTIEDMGDWVAGLVHELDLAPAHLVGFSLGTFVALEAAAQDPTCARSLSLIGTASAMPVHPELLTSSYDDVARASKLMTSWGLGSRAHKGGHQSPGTWLVGSCSALIARSPHDALGHDMVACNEYTGALAAAERVEAPVTFILGSEDKMTPIKKSADLVQAVRNKTVVTIESSGHMMPVEDPIRVREEVASAIGWAGARA